MVVLPEPGGARADDHAVRRARQRLEDRERLAWHAEVGEAEQRAPLVEDPEHALLAVDGGGRGDAHVERYAVDLDLELAVLGPAALDDVHLGHDLDATHERGAHDRRQVEDLVQCAVDAVADAHAVGHRLDVDVGGALAHRLGQQQVHDLDDGRLLVEARGGAVGLAGAPLGLARLEDPHVLVDVRGGAVRDLDGALDLADATHVELGRLAQHLPQALRDRGVARVRDHDVEPELRLAEDDRAPVVCLLLGQGRDRGRIRELPAQVDHLEPELLTQQRREIAFGDHALRDQVLAEALAGFRRRVQGLHQLLGVQQPPADQELTEHPGAALAAGVVVGPARCRRRHRGVDARVAGGHLRLERLDRERDLGRDAVGVEELVLLDVVEIGVLDRVDIPLELTRGFLAGLQQTHAALFLTSPHPDGGPNALLPTSRVPVDRWRPPGERSAGTERRTRHDGARRRRRGEEDENGGAAVTTSSWPCRSSGPWPGRHGRPGSAGPHRRS